VIRITVVARRCRRRAGAGVVRVCRLERLAEPARAGDARGAGGESAAVVGERPGVAADGDLGRSLADGERHRAAVAEMVWVAAVRGARMRRAGGDVVAVAYVERCVEAAGAGHVRRARGVGRPAVDERAVRARQRDAGRCLVDLEAAGAGAGGVVVVAAVAGGGGGGAGVGVVVVADLERLLEVAGASRLGGAG